MRRFISVIVTRWSASTLLSTSPASAESTVHANVSRDGCCRRRVWTLTATRRARSPSSNSHVRSAPGDRLRQQHRARLVDRDAQVLDVVEREVEPRREARRSPYAAPTGRRRRPAAEHHDVVAGRCHPSARLRQKRRCRRPSTSSCNADVLSRSGPRRTPASPRRSFPRLCIQTARNDALECTCLPNVVI